MSLILDDELKGIINTALSERTPMVLASVDAQGQPRLTFRGSVQTFSDDQVGFWARNPTGGTMDNIGVNPHVSMMMRNPDTRVMLQLIGRARRRKARGSPDRSPARRWPHWLRHEAG